MRQVLLEERRLLRPKGAHSPVGGASSPPPSAPSDRQQTTLPGMTTSGAAVPWEFGKLVFLFFYLAVSGFSNWAVFSFTHDRAGRIPLPDVFFEILPQQDWAAQWGDWSVTANLICLIALVVFHRHRLVIVRRAFFVAGTLYAMRSVSLLVTQLPPGYENNHAICRDQENRTTLNVFFSRLFEQTIRLGFQSKSDMLCGDLLFSGHTLVMMTCTLCVHYYLPKKWRPLSIVPYTITFFGMAFLILSHTHYTIDVVFAYWLTNFVFVTYHAYVEVDIFVERRQSVLHQMWLLKVVGWLEENIVPGRVENEFALPFEGYVQKHILQDSPGHHKQISIDESSTISRRETSCSVENLSSASTFGLP